MENKAAVAPKHISLVTSELFTCRAVAILGAERNYLAHIFEYPREKGSHSLESMHKMLDKSADMLGIPACDLPVCKVAVVCGSQTCDDIDFPLSLGLSERKIQSDWFDGRDSGGDVYAFVHENEITLGHNEMEETEQKQESVKSNDI
nr:hypothetical protein [Pantoea sp. 201603H]